MGKRIRCTLFIALFIILVIITGRIIKTPHGLNWASGAGMDMVYKHKNAYDVCICGTSTIIANVSNQRLFEEYGIASVSVGEPEQPLWLTKNTIKDLLRKQKPQVIVLDSRSLFYTDQVIALRISQDEEYMVHNSIDPIRSPLIKLAALSETQEVYADLDPIEYMVDILGYHNHWKDLTDTHFLSYTLEDTMNGNVNLMGIGETPTGLSTETQIPDRCRREFHEICELCRKNDVELLLCTNCYEPYAGRASALQEIAKEENCRYVDFNDSAEELGFEKADRFDVVHFNVSGTQKWSDYLGKYLVDHYHVQDRRESEAYQWYYDQSPIYHEKEHFMEEEAAFYKAVSLNDYLDIFEMYRENDELTLMACINDDGTDSLDETEMNMLRSIGVQSDLLGKYRWSWAFVSAKDRVEEAMDKKESVTLEGEINGNTYSVTSGGLKSGQKAEILINGQDYAQKGRGINLVIFNHVQGTVVSSVFFDTFAEANPPAKRYTSVS